MLEEAGMQSVCLNSVWNDLDQETDRMETLISQRKIQLLLIDSYFVTSDYLHRLHRRTHVLYIDDLGQHIYPCSTLVNYALYAGDWNYQARYAGVKLLLGPKYAPLRREFENLPPRTTHRHVRNILVTTGGGDPLNIAGQFVEKAKQTPATAGFHYHIAAGRFNEHLGELDMLAGRYPGVSVHRNVTYMSELMNACDIAVSAAGTTLYELCACGTPTIAYMLADNQAPNGEAFQRYGLALWAGDARTKPAFVQKLLVILADLAENREQREHMSQAMRKTVDGNGTRRLARHIMQIAEERRENVP